MNILAIGNSFSEDATRYLHQIARSDKYDLTVVNLYIGGCPLSRHYRNMLSGEKAYSLMVNGYDTGFTVSLEEALLNRDWDFVVMQQVSHQSIHYETYQPYLNELSVYVKKCTPEAKQVLHQTWAYEQGSKRLCEELGYQDQKAMYRDLEEAYCMASKDIGAYGIIPSGELFQKLILEGVPKLHRDTFHASLGLGRYALALLWYRVFTGNPVMDNDFYDFDEAVGKENIMLIKGIVEQYDCFRE